MDRSAIKVYRAPVRRLSLSAVLKRTVAISAIATVLLVAGLSVQMAVGSDPALGPKLAGQRASSGSSDGGSSPVVVTPTPTENDGFSDDDGFAVPVAPAPVAPTTVAPTTPAPAPAPVQTTTS